MKRLSIFSLVSAGVFFLACGDDDPAPNGPGPGNGNIDETLDPCRGTALPDDQHFSADGTCARLVASNLGAIRQITFAPNGDLFGVTVEGKIHRFRDVDEDGVYAPGEPESITWASTGGNGNNVHLHEGYLYAGSPDGVVRFPYTAESNSGGKPEAVLVGQPSTGTHTFHTVHIWDGYLYVHMGSENNFVAPMLPEYDTQRSLIKRFELSRLSEATPFNYMTDGEVYAVGLRNAVGFTRDADKRIYAVVNGVDELTYNGIDIHNDNPGEAIVQVEQDGRYGYPYCFTAQLVAGEDGELIEPGTQLRADILDPGFVNPHDDAWCAANSKPPTSFVQAHSAPLDIVFYEGEGSSALPEKYLGGAFITLHGSWDRDEPTGYKVVWLKFDDNGNAAMPTIDENKELSFPYEVVLGGGKKGQHQDGRWGWSGSGEGEDIFRPVGVAISPLDGALYVSSDNANVFGLPERVPNGALYRIGKATSTGVPQ
jgi:glucose/arabinose dehydrogenase